MNCSGDHSGGGPYDPAQHSDRCMAQTVGDMIRLERSRLLPGADPRIWQLPCPKCISIHRQPYTLVLDVRVERYRCKLCKFDISAAEINDAAKETA